MRQLAVALVVAAGVAAACDETPKNEYSAACLHVLSAERGVWIFGARAKPIAEAFCSCAGKEIKASKRLDPADKTKILAYLKSFDGTEDFPKIASAFGKFHDAMGDKYSAFNDITDKCLERLTK